MSAMRAALIPMKDLAGAKQRLASKLALPERRALALAMLSDVIAACRESGCFDVVAVTSADAGVAEAAVTLGAVPLVEPPDAGGLNEGLTWGGEALAQGMALGELVILPADIPLARAEDVRAVCDALAAAGDRCVIVRARDGGTNALALRPPRAIPMRFGPQSCDAHIAAARAAGLDVVELALDRLAFDVDAPEDLDALASLPLGAATSAWLAAHTAGRTR